LVSYKLSGYFRKFALYGSEIKSDMFSGSHTGNQPNDLVALIVSFNGFPN